MSKVATDLTNPLFQGLACAALSPGLRSILVFDAPSSALPIAGQNLVGMLKHVTGCQVTQVQLSVVETEEDLWGGLALQQESANQSFSWQRGVLAEGRDETLRLVIIPDLARLSLVTARACIALMGSKVAYLERHGHQDNWQPNLCWLAGCARQDIGLVSSHLLDRFALRLSYQDWGEDDRETDIRRWLQEPQVLSTIDSGPQLPEWLEVLPNDKSLPLEIMPSAQKRVLDYVPVTNDYSVRRELALLRLAQAQAQLLGLKQVAVEQVDLAAAMIGSELMEPEPKSTKPKSKTSSQSLSDISSMTDEREDKESDKRIDGSEDKPYQEPVYAPDKEEMLPSEPIVMERKVANPYPEDTTPIEREAASLRLPLRRFKNMAAGHGAIVGVEPTKTPQDLAIVSTLLEAAKYQPMRQEALLQHQNTTATKHQVVNGECLNQNQLLILRPTDLRRYRRAVVPEQMLALVLDYTCLKDCRWQESLMPYWQWAYEERASVCLIRVGAANARHELQAEKLMADKVLVPKIRLSLEVSRGRATPLAHGLDLVLQTLRHALQHGRTAVQQAILVVITDGRGNVPLEASRNGKITPPVGRQGIEDALKVARQIADMQQVNTIVLNPQPEYSSDIPVTLAKTLGAKISKISLLKVWEVEE